MASRGLLFVVAHGLSCPVACGDFLDTGSNLCLLHWQADPVDHYRGSVYKVFFFFKALKTVPSMELTLYTSYYFFQDGNLIVSVRLYFAMTHSSRE